jgi:hypothetical protein
MKANKITPQAGVLLGPDTDLAFQVGLHTGG